MAAFWCWCLLACQLAAWGSAVPLGPEKIPGKATGSDPADFSSDHLQLKDLTQGASDTGKGSVDVKPPQIVPNSLQNNQPPAPQQDPDKLTEIENSSINHKGSQSDAVGSINPQEDTDKSKEDQANKSDISSLAKPNIKKSEQGEDPSIKDQNIKSGASTQGSSKSDSVQAGNTEKTIDSSEVSKTVISDPGSNVKETKQSEDLQTKNQNPQSDVSAQEDTSGKKLDSSQPTNPHKDTDKSKGNQADKSGTSFAKSETKDSKQGEDPSTLGQNIQSGASAQDSLNSNSVQAGNTEKKIGHSEVSKTVISDPGSDVKETKQSEDLQTKNQNPQSGMSPQEDTSGKKLDSSQPINPQEDTVKSEKDQTDKSGTSIKTQNIQPGASPQDSSKLDPVHAKNTLEKIDHLEKSKTVVSDQDFSELESNVESKQMEDLLAKDQDHQPDQHPQMLNPVESPKNEEQVVDPEDEHGKGLGDEKKESAKHEEDSEGTPRNGSENSHFFAYLVTTAIVVAALYIAYHNKRKIIAFALEGKKSKITRRPKSSDYQRLDQKI